LLAITIQKINQSYDFEKIEHFSKVSRINTTDKQPVSQEKDMLSLFPEKKKP